MVQRDVTARLKLDASGYIAGVEKAKLATKGLANDITKTAAGGSKSAAVLGSSFGLVGLTAGLAGATMVSAAADFEQGMSNVKATGADAVRNIGALRQAALDAGAATKYSATEAAAGIEELSKAGLTSKDVLAGGLSGALNLAAAGNIEVADAANITATALQQFQLRGTEASHVADLLAAAAGKAQGEVGDFAYALKYAGVPAKSLGVSIEETTGALALFASKGILGEQAGTNLRSIMLSLAAPTSIAKREMDKYGLSLYDSKGKFVGLSEAAQQLHNKLEPLSEAERNTALNNIFGQNAIQGAITLYEGGAKSVDKWTKAVNDSGYAAEVAKTKMDNLKGDVETLKGSLDTLFVSGGGGPAKGLRGGTQGLNWLVNQAIKGNFSPNVFANVEGRLLANVQNIGASGRAGVSRSTYFKIQALGADAAVRDVVRVARAANLTPRQIRIVLKQQGWETSRIIKVNKALQETQRIAQVRSTLTTFGFTPDAIDAVADALKTAHTRADLRVSLTKRGFDTKDVDVLLGLLEKLGAIKPEPTAKVKDQATKPLRGIKDMLTGLDGQSATVTVTTVKKTVVLPAGGGALYGGTLHGFADGGFWGPRAMGAIRGPGTDTSDSIPAMLSNGEHVLTASDVRAAGGQDAVFRLRAGLQAGLFSFASGGPIGMTSNQWALEIARLQADMEDNRSQLKTTKGRAARRVLDLEYREDQAALRRLRAGLTDDYDLGFDALRDAATSPVSLFDSISDSPWMKQGGFGNRATQKLAQIRTLAGKVLQLRKAGLNGALIAEIYSLGSAQGIAAADELLKNPTEIRQLNAAYSGIQKLNGVVATAAYVPPATSANVRVSIEGFHFDMKKQTASLTAVIKDHTGRIISEQAFNSAVH